MQGRLAASVQRFYQVTQTLLSRKFLCDGVAGEPPAASRDQASERLGKISTLLDRYRR